MTEVQEGDFVASISELVAIFREACIALIPTAERSHLMWRDLDTSDDWDKISTSLYDTLVAAPIANDRSARSNAFPLPRYDLDYDDYSTFSWIRCRFADQEGYYVFVRLLSGVEPFDTIQAVEIDTQSLHAGERHSLPWRDVILTVVSRDARGAAVESDSIAAVE